MGWLTGAAGKECGISWQILTPERDVPLSFPTSDKTSEARASARAEPEQKIAAKRRFRVVSDDGYLNIRRALGPTMT